MTHVTPESGPTGNPLLEVLRQRHPEVDIVVLPDPAVERASAAGGVHPALEGAAILSPDTVVHEVAALAQAIATRLAAQPAWQGAAVERGGRWHRTGDGLRWFEAVIAVAGLAPGDNVTLLRATGNALLGLGWLARPVPGDRPRLAARRGAYRAAARVRPDGLVLTVASGLLADAETGPDADSRVSGR